MEMVEAGNQEHAQDDLLNCVNAGTWHIRAARLLPSRPESTFTQVPILMQSFSMSSSIKGSVSSSMKSSTSSSMNSSRNSSMESSPSGSSMSSSRSVVAEQHE
eukprot:1158325-Pelagomonas_calceolata.AAC.6